MGRTFLRQDTQIRQSDLFADDLTVGSTLESGAASVEGDLNSLRSQVRRLLWADASAVKWYDDVATVNGKKRAVNALNTALDTAEEHRFLFRAQVLTDITVTALQNWEILVVASSEAPSIAAAIGAGTYQGAIMPALAALEFGTHKLTAVAGPDALSPKNLCMVRDATTGDPIMSGDKIVYALIQAENGVVDGDVFNDTTKRCQLSFVRENATADALEACPVADIAGKSINYSYVRRLSYTNLPETAFLTGVFLDNMPVGSTPTLDTVIDNQVGPATQTDRNIAWQITDSYWFALQTSAGADIFKVAPAVAGDAVTFIADTWGVTNTNTATFTNGVQVDTSGTAISVGATAGQIASAGLLTLSSAAAADLTLNASGELVLVDGNKAGSSYAGSLKLSDTQAEWTNFDSVYGEVSLLAAIVAAGSKDKRSKTVGVVTPVGGINAGVNVTGFMPGGNLDAQLGDYSTVTFVTDVDVYLNGVLLRNGANVGAGHDVYPGTTQANGDLMFAFKLKQNDVLTMIVHGLPLP
jgi:hypothetical protein